MTLSRRYFLRSSGVAVSLPMLRGMDSVRGDEPDPATQTEGSRSGPRRMIAICAPLGIHTPYLFPEKTGADYEPTPYLEPLQGVRRKLSVMSGLMHPMVDGGHAAEKSFLTAAPHPGQPSFRNTISVDQYAAEQIGHRTRFPSLTLSADVRGLSFTRAGVQVPTETRPSKIFERLFLDGSADEKAEQVRRIRDGQSILDLVGGQVKSIRRSASRADHETLDQYTTSVRELEKRLASAEDWANRPKPKVDYDRPTDIEERGDFTGKMSLMLDLMFLAVQTDSTRLITLKGFGGAEVVNLDGVDDGWHNLSHHGRDPKKIEQLAIIEREEMRLLGQFLERLDAVREAGDNGDETLLDRTAVLMGSNLGNASSHNNTNLPILTAGGGFRHGGHLAYTEETAPPLSNVLTSFLHHLGLPVDTFGTGTGPLREWGS